MSAETPMAVDGDGYHSHVRTDVIPLIPRSGGSLLDVGGGIGGTALRARELGLVERAGVIDRVAAHPSIDFSYRGDLEDPAVLDEVERKEGPFSTILCLDILEHLIDPWAMVGRLHGMLAPGGAIVASIPNVRHHSVIRSLILRSSWELVDAGILDRTHLRFFTRSSAIALMTGSGLTLDLVAPQKDGGIATRVLGWVPVTWINDFAVLQYLVRVTRRDAQGG